MAQAIVQETALWAKHIHGDASLVERLMSLPAGAVVRLEVDGVLGDWRRMDDGRDGRPTRGLRPLGRTRDFWKALNAKRRGEAVILREAASTMPGVTEDQRRAARDALLNTPRRSGGEAKGRPSNLDEAVAAIGLPPIKRDTLDPAAKARLEALERLFAMSKGWRSDAPYGPRDELYDR